MGREDRAERDSRGGMDSKSYREWALDCKVYIGNLTDGASKVDIEGAFGKYGPLRNVWVARNPPGFAFVEYEDPRDAEDATRALDGTRIAGARVRVEMSHGRTRRGGYHPSPDGRGGDERGDRGDRGGGGRRGGGRNNGSNSSGYSSGSKNRRNNDRNSYREERGGGGAREERAAKGRSRSRSRSPPPRRASRYSRSKSRSKSRSRSRSVSRSPPPRSPRSPPPARARTPPSRSRSRSVSPARR